MPQSGAQGPQTPPGRYFTACGDSPAVAGACGLRVQPWRRAALLDGGAPGVEARPPGRAGPLPNARAAAAHVRLDDAVPECSPALVQQQGGWRSASVLLRTYARWMPQPSATQAQPAAETAPIRDSRNAG